MVVALPALYAIGALFAAVVLRFGDVSPMVQVVRGVFTALCGMSFPIVVLPDLARTVALTLPPTYLIADLRAVMLNGVGLGRLLGDFAILLGMGAVLAVLAVAAFRNTEQYARRGGRLAQY
jgi:ABC-2 type transport system permease protein